MPGKSPIREQKNIESRTFGEEKRRLAYLLSIFLMCTLIVLSGWQLVVCQSEILVPVENRDEDERWSRPRAYIEPLPDKREFEFEELSIPRAFSTRNISVMFPENVAPGIGVTISPTDLPGDIVFYSSNGTLLSTIHWSKLPGDALGLSILSKPERFHGGKLWMNITGTGIFAFLNRTLPEDFLLTGSHMEWMSAHSVDTFSLPSSFSQNAPLNWRLTTRISVSSGLFSARIYDDNFHLLAEIDKASSATRQLAMGMSTTAFFVIMSDIGVYIQVDLFYSPVSSLVPYLLVLLPTQIIILAALVLRYIRIYTPGKRRKGKNRPQEGP